MNSMPAASIARCSFARASSETRGPNPPSSRLTVGRDSPFLPEPRRVRDRDHVRYVAKQPCLVCGRRPSDAHHLRFAQHPAFGRKVSDEFTVPLCRGHHCQIHRCGDEAEWWKKDEAGIRESAKAEAVTRVVAWQLSREMKRQGMSKARLAKLMNTSRAQVDRILKAKGNVTIETLQRAAELVGRQLRLELV